MQIFLLEELEEKISRNKNRKIVAAADIIKSGGIVAFPTETVYGLGADIFNISAIKRIYKIKTRSYNKPLAAHISSLNQVQLLSEAVPDLFYVLAENFLPGPLSIIIPASKKISEIVTAGTGTIAIRYPSNQICKEFISACEVPLAATSANISGNLSPVAASQVVVELDNKIDAIIDAGECKLKIESTVISIVSGTIKILREGAISSSDIMKLTEEL